MNEIDSEGILSALRNSEEEISAGISRLSQIRDQLLHSAASSCESSSAAFVDSFKHTLSCSVDQILSLYDVKLSEIHFDAVTAESGIRNSINHTFQGMKVRHLAELEQIEFDKAIEIRAKSQQRIPRVRDLEEKAKCYARSNKLDRAIQIRGEAKTLLQKERNTRMTQTETKYAVLNERTLEKQGIELENLQQSLCVQLIEARGKFDRDIQFRKRKTVALLHRQLVGAICSVRKAMKGKVYSMDYIAILTQFLEMKLVRENRSDLFVDS
jgi:tetratricopeptide (TPR) repeat protein